jgi:toll-like receptor 10
MSTEAWAPRPTGERGLISNFSNMALRKVPRDVTPATTTLDLSYNLLYQLQSSDFHSFSKLHFLILCHKIQELDTRNKIQELDTRNKIQQLDTRNKIQQLDTRNKIQQLDTRNKIQQLDTRIFDLNKELSYLDLSYNRLKSITLSSMADLI